MYWHWFIQLIWALIQLLCVVLTVIDYVFTCFTFSWIKFHQVETSGLWCFFPLCDKTKFSVGCFVSHNNNTYLKIQCQFPGGFILLMSLYKLNLVLCIFNVEKINSYYSMLCSNILLHVSRWELLEGSWVSPLVPCWKRFRVCIGSTTSHAFFISPVKL